MASRKTNVILTACLAFFAAFAIAGCGGEVSNVAGTASSPAAEASSAATREVALEEATVERVVDGDTIIVSVDGARERVRLIGINTPESVAPEEERNTEEGEEASAFTKAIVQAGDVVWLESDEEDRDQYDRLLRYVWLDQPADAYDEDEIGRSMLNAVIVEAGYAYARAYEPNTAHQDVLNSLYKQAKREGRGLWAS